MRQRIKPAEIRVPSGTLHPNSVPYYFQVANLLGRKIEQGEFPPGAKLPNELELAGLFGISRVPIRQALSLLEARGILRRERGRGTFVADSIPAQRLFRLTGHIEDYREQGMHGRVRLLSVREVPATHHVAESLGISPGEKTAQIQRMGVMGKIPFCYNTHYLPSDLFRRIPQADLRSQTMLNIFKNRLHISLGRIYQTIEARTADSEIANHLSVQIMAPVMYVETLVCEKNGTPLKFSQIFFPGERFKYGTEFVSARGNGRARRKSPAGLFRDTQER